MDVTKKNFAQVALQFEDVIEKADFLAIDVEFSGLFTTVTNDYLDTYEQLYAKSRQNISQFQVIQMGISLFKMISEKEFDCHSFNFYIFPTRCSFLDKQDKERYFLSQASSLSFLADNGFDFNKLIREGISYLNLNQEQIVQEKIKDRNPDNVHISNDVDKSFVDDMMKQIGEFMNDQETEELCMFFFVYFAKCALTIYRFVFNLVLPSVNAFKRRLIYEAVANSQYNDHLFLAPSGLDKNRVNVKKSTLEEKKERERVKLLEMSGFVQIIKLIVKNRKPLVGHNLYLDLLYIYNTFIEPLPQSYSEFKSSFHSLFPVVYDTRYISSIGSLNTFIPNNCKLTFISIYKLINLQFFPFSGLGKLYQTILEPPFFQTTVNLKNCEKEQCERHHEAGYDSFITGYSFINLIRYLYKEKLSLDFNPATHMFSNGILSEFQNKVGIFKCYDLKYMNLEADDLDLDLLRSHIFHVVFPKEWKTSDLHNLFNKQGGLHNVTFIDDTSAFCVLKEKDKAGQVVEQLICNNQSPCKVCQFK